ncbi:hypothetical protein [Brevibacillus porteri]|uniref:hypothetical protein n=1 Tax=Brevibacillus porteri TaxID=2126350 RepID=UPI00363CE9E7
MNRGNTKMKYTCKQCGNSRFFYVEVSVKAKERIDLQKGSRHGKIYDIEPDNLDNYFEDSFYCGKCNEPVDMAEWENYES